MSLSQNENHKHAIEQWNTRPRPHYEHIRVTPLSPALGAEVGGIDLSRELTPEQLGELKTAIADNLVLVFRDQNVDGEQHKRFVRHFGTLHQHKLATDNSLTERSHDPEILAWKTTSQSRFTAGEAWHSDVSCDAEPIWGSVLKVTKTPEIGGGDTAFANMLLAYETLSDSLKSYLQGLTAIHDGAHAWTRGYGAQPKEGQKFPASEHPVVARHPVNGKPFLFVNAGFTSRIPQLSKTESDALLQLLFQHIEQSLILQTRVRWAPGSLVFWDNWATQHHAVWDYYPYERWGERVSATLGAAPQAFLDNR